MQFRMRTDVLQRDNEDSAAGHRVVIVDDDAAFRSMCRYVLEAERLRCDEAADGKQALLLAGEGCFDLVLLDVNLPEHSGAQSIAQASGEPAVSASENHYDVGSSHGG